MPIPEHRHLRPRLISWLLRLSTAAALAIDAYVHADLAGRYDPNRGSAAISQGDLFRLEAGVSAFAALALILTAWRLTWTLALLVAGSALGGLLLYRYYDPGLLDPLPDMYEPSWYPEKTLAAIAEGAAVITAAFGLFGHGSWRRSTPSSPRARSEHPRTHDVQRAPPEDSRFPNHGNGDAPAALDTVHRIDYRHQASHRERTAMNPRSLGGSRERHRRS